MPRDVWRYAVSLERFADLSTPERLVRLGLSDARPDRVDWPALQTVGHELHAEGYEAVLYASPARPAGSARCVFRPRRTVPGVRPLPPAVRHAEPPPPPTGLRT